MEEKIAAPPAARPPLWATLLGCVAILALRRPDLLRNPQFWAEDGTVFFLQANTLGAAALWQPSAGYLHTVLRIVAWGATAFDPVLSPAIYVAAAAALTLYVAARTQSARCPLPPSPGYALAVVAVPDAFEVLLTLTNLQWVLAGGLLLVLIAREPERWRQRGHDLAAALLLGLTGPFVIALLPFFAWRAWRRRTRFSVALAAIAALAAGVQALLLVRDGAASAHAAIAGHLLLAIPGVRIGISLLGGGHGGSGLGVVLASAIGGATIAGVGQLAALPGRGGTERHWLAGAFALLLAAALFRCRFVLPAVFYGAGSRYFFPLQLVALWLLIAAAVDAPRRARRASRALLAIGTLLNLPRLREPEFTDHHWAEAAARIRKGERTLVRINPDWEFTMPGQDAPRGIGPERAGAAEALVNLSTRCRVAPGQPVLIGFALRGSAPQLFLVRAVGPSLARFGVRDAIARPKLSLLIGGESDAAFRPARNGTRDAVLAEATARCRAFPLEAGAADLAGLVRLQPGVYTVMVSAEGDAAGEVLFEIYQVPPPGAPAWGS